MTEQTRLDLSQNQATADANRPPILTGLTENILTDEAEWTVGTAPGGFADTFNYDSTNLRIPTGFARTGIGSAGNPEFRNVIVPTGDLGISDNPLNNLDVAAQTGDVEAQQRNTTSSSGGSFNCPDENQTCVIEYAPPNFTNTASQQTETQRREERRQQQLEDQRTISDAQEDAIQNLRDAPNNTVNECLPSNVLVTNTDTLLRDVARTNREAVTAREEYNNTPEDQRTPNQLREVERLESVHRTNQGFINARLQRARDRSNTQRGNETATAFANRRTQTELTCNDIWNNAGTIGTVN